MKAVILAGGTGTRLWPMSRQTRPKQFFEIVGENSLIRDTYRRLLPAFPQEKIYFSISPALGPLLHKYFPEVDDRHIFIEPEKRDTGPAMGFVAAMLELADPDEPVVFVPSDHYIADEEIFLRTLAIGDQIIRETGKLVDIGIQPTFPNTHLGYTHIKNLVETRDAIEIYTFAGHKEKPDYQTAKNYLKDGSFLWHANYYMWTPRGFMEAFERYAPEIGAKLRNIQKQIVTKAQGVTATYSCLPKISFDYAVTEKINPDDVLILKGNFGWSDVGAWDTLYERLVATPTPSGEESSNVTKGRCLLVDTHGSLVYAPADKLVAVLGLEDVVVVDAGDALLVCHRQQAARVKEIINRLQDDQQDDVL